MTAEEIMAMPAGPEMDVLVAVGMGWTLKHPPHTCDGYWYDAEGFVQAPAVASNDYYCPHEAWSPSTNDAEALVLWKELTRRGWSLWVGPDVENGWAAQIKPKRRNLHEFYRDLSFARLMCMCFLLARQAEGVS